MECGPGIGTLQVETAYIAIDARAILCQSLGGIHPMHLHRHSFELTRLAGIPVAGGLKDVVMLGGYQEAEVDSTAENPGLTLFHCHQQLHMDFGFMTLFGDVEECAALAVCCH